MSNLERRALQVAVAAGSLVPLGAGAAGMLLGPWMIDGVVDTDLDSHFRYLSGLLFAIGAAYAASVPRIEIHQQRFVVLTALVVTGGLARLFGLFAFGPPGMSMQLALVMELIVTPSLMLWQRRVARLAA